jgi:hypothetical protein
MKINAAAILPFLCAVVMILSFLCAASLLGASAGAESVGFPQASWPQGVSPNAGAARTEDLAEADRLNADVVQLFAQHKYSEALPKAKRVLQIREALLSPSDHGIEVARINLAEIYIEEKKLSAGLSLYQVFWQPARVTWGLTT